MSGSKGISPTGIPLDSASRISSSLESDDRTRPSPMEYPGNPPRTRSFQGRPTSPNSAL